MFDATDVVMVGERSSISYTHIRPAWAKELAALEKASYPTADSSDLYDEKSLLLLAQDFPQGCFAGFDGKTLAAMGLGIRTHFDFDNPEHTISEIVPSNYSGSGHTADGEWYYGTGISTRPEYRRRGIGSELYVLRKQVCHELNLRGIVAGGVIPGYADHKNRMSAADYIAEVSSGRLYDPTLSFQLKNGFEALAPLPDYLRDPAVDNYAVLIVWRNPDHTP